MTYAADAIRDRVSAIRGRIDAALARAGDPGRSVTLVAVTKGHPAQAVDAVVEAGISDVGENRVQEALSKSRSTVSAPRWHLIGHLQRNKVRKALGLFSVLHSLDSIRLVETLAQAEASLDCFLEINVSGETRKTGAAPEEASAIRRAALAVPGLRIVGLMTMAPYDEDPEASRPCFRALRELAADLSRRGDGPPLEALSMGMSGDFEVAVEEGATHVRIGTAILGPRSAGTAPPAEVS